MNKTIKKVMALVLTVLMLMSVATTAFAASAEDDPSIPVSEVATTEAPADDSSEVEAHRSMIDIFIDYVMEVFNFFKYIFYDVFLGEPA
ncbi:MAG: hypothetical protein IJ491_08275 [Clostridia bacterium]|nr:hypothetical protein [Clostridia bacterium]